MEQTFTHRVIKGSNQVLVLARAPSLTPFNDWRESVTLKKISLVFNTVQPSENLKSITFFLKMWAVYNNKRFDCLFSRLVSWCNDNNKQTNKQTRNFHNSCATLNGKLPFLVGVRLPMVTWTVLKTGWMVVTSETNVCANKMISAWSNVNFRSTTNGL